MKTFDISLLLAMLALLSVATTSADLTTCARQCRQEGSTSAEDRYATPNVLVIAFDGEFDIQTNMIYQRAREEVIALGGTHTYMQFPIQATLNSQQSLEFLNQFNQIWVLDFTSNSYQALGSGPPIDQTPQALLAFQRITSWFQARETAQGFQNGVILDGRIISSVWERSGNRMNIGCSNGAVSLPNQNRDEVQLLRNYVLSIAKQGGGLLLGTDHSTTGGAAYPHQCTGGFEGGMNTLAANLGFEGFHGCIYDTSNFAVVVDKDSEVMKGNGNQAGHAYCPSSNLYLWDDSSTSVVATGNQNNGYTMYPVAWHGTDATTGFAAISSTVRGTVGLLVSIVTPTCGEVFVSGSSIVVFAQVDNFDGDVSDLEYSWKVDGVSVAGTDLTLLLSGLADGFHTVQLLAKTKDSLSFSASSSSTTCFSIGSEEGELHTVPCACGDAQAPVNAHSDTNTISIEFDSAPCL